MQSRLNSNNLSKELIINALRQELPGKVAQQTMLPDGRTLLIPINNNKIKNSAVLILIYPIENELNICLTRRSHELKYHPGQISFPGGKCEPYDKNPLETALRETEEEIGIDTAKLEILGKLSDLYVSVSNFNISPFVAWSAQIPVFKMNTVEVDEIISLPLNTILVDDNKTNKMVITSYGNIEVPCYYIENYLIWGATSMMIAELEAILKQHCYHRATHSNNDDNDQ